MRTVVASDRVAPSGLSLIEHPGCKAYCIARAENKAVAEAYDWARQTFPVSERSSAGSAQAGAVRGGGTLARWDSAVWYHGQRSRTYFVDTQSCSCAGFTHTQGFCRHINARDIARYAPSACSSTSLTLHKLPCCTGTVHALSQRRRQIPVIQSRCAGHQEASAPHCAMPQRGPRSLGLLCAWPYPRCLPIRLSVSKGWNVSGRGYPYSSLLTESLIDSIGCPFSFKHFLKLKCSFWVPINSTRLSGIM